MAVILGISASIGDGAIAVISDGKVLYADALGPKGSHGRMLVPRAIEVLAKHGLTLDSVDVFGAEIGPGSFTGIRLALSAARAFAWARGKRVASVYSLDVLANTAKIPARAERLAVALDARKELLYYADYKLTPAPARTKGPVLMPVNDAIAALTPNTVCIGDAWSKLALPDGIPVVEVEYSPEVFARLLADAPIGEWKDLMPLYLRRADAEDVYDARFPRR